MKELRFIEQQIALALQQAEPGRLWGTQQWARLVSGRIGSRDNPGG
jgi:hypothetical protein